MRLANLHDRATIVTDTGGIDVHTASDGTFGPDLASVYDAWDEFRRAFADVRAHPAAAVDLDLEGLGPPSPMPRQVFAIGTNYVTHADETAAKLPKKPAPFTKYPTCLTGPYADVALPSRGMVDWEVELVVVVGRRAERLEREEAWRHVAGLTVGQDISERWLQLAAGRQFALGKSHPGFGPMGPWLVTPDEVDDPDDLELGCAIDGETMQRARTNEMIFDVPTLLVELSAVVPLLPGDVIFTGTPGGVGGTRDPQRFLRAGETLESWIGGIGVMKNRFVASSQPGEVAE